MAADRQRLAAALAYEEERRRRMMESVPTTDNLPPVQPTRRSLRTDLENLSSGIGQGVVNQLEGVKALVTDPVGTARAAYEGVKGVVRDPSVLADALRYTAQKATSGPLGAGEVIGEMIGPMRGKGPMAEIDVYHGSPHRFEEFDASKIGTGEGAQAYGHGIYLAESPKVAEGYKKTVTQSMTTGAQRRLQSAGGDIDKAIAETEAKLAKYRQGGAKSYADVAEEDLRGLNQYKQSGEWASGNFYTADLPDEMVDRMLDWDKPLSKQPEAVRNALQSILEQEYSPKLVQALNGNKTGGEIVESLNKLLGGPSVASAYLKAEGIPGVRYLDAGSRGQSGTGTRNFVVFPGEEKKVKILKRE
jgi:hypothetical protein